MSVARRIASGLLWGQLGMSGRTLITFLISILLARALGVKEYGLYVALISLADLLLRVTDLGLHALLTTWIPRLGGGSNGDQRRYLVRRALLARALLMELAAIGFILAFPRTVAAMGHPRIGDYLGLILLFFFVRGAMDGFLFLVIAQVRMRLYSAVEVGISLLQLAGVLLLIRQGPALDHLLMLLIGVGLVQLIGYGWGSRDLWLGSEQPMMLGRPVGFALTAWVGTLFDYLRQKGIDIILLMILLGDEAAAAHYDIAYLLAVRGGSFLLSSLDQMATPLLSRALAEEGIAGLRRAWGLLAKLALYLGAPLLAFTAFHAEGIVALLYDEPFLPAAPLLAGLALLTLGAVLAQGELATAALFPLDRERTFVGLTFVNGVLNLAAGLLLIPTFGAMGAVWATGGAALITSLAAQRITLMAIGGRLPWGFMARLGLIVTLCLGGSWLAAPTSVWGFLGTSILYGLAVTLLMIRLCPFDAFERETLAGLLPGAARLFERIGPPRHAGRNP